MPRKKSHITVTDQFCGAGGSSQGVRNLSNRKGGGIEVELALNHWKLAIETHNTNFPNTRHDCTDISACDPRRYPTSDILITSPECTNHSLAKGKKIVQKQMDLFTSGANDAAAERSRATMWDVCRFAEYHNYNIIIVENVVDARKWVMFDAWLNAMYVLGYLHKSVYLNSQHCHPTPQSRDRMYIVFWKKGNKAPKLDYTPNSYCHKCEKDVLAIQTWKNSDKKFGKYKQQYVYSCPVHAIAVEPYYYAAFNCIDWSDIGTRIGDRKKQLSDNTTTRIQYGLKKYGSEPFQVQTVNGQEHQHRSRSLYEPAFTHTTLQSQAFIINDQHSTGINYRVKGVGETVQGVTTQPHFKVVMPFVVKNEHTKKEEGYTKEVTDSLQTQATWQTMGLVTPQIVANYSPGYSKPVSESIPSITCTDHNALLTAPFIVENKKSSKTKPITAAAPCLTTKPHLGLITSESFNSFITHYYNGSNCVKHISEPVGTATGNDRMSIVSYQQPKIEDCYYRMLKAHEIKLAMAFDADYIILGSGKDQVKQCGNAVTPPAMEWLVQQCVDSLN